MQGPGQIQYSKNKSYPMTPAAQQSRNMLIDPVTWYNYGVIQALLQ